MSYPSINKTAHNFFYSAHNFAARLQETMTDTVITGHRIIIQHPEYCSAFHFVYFSPSTEYD